MNSKNLKVVTDFLKSNPNTISSLIKDANTPDVVPAPTLRAQSKTPLINMDSSLFIVRVVIISMLLAWGVYMIVMRFTTSDGEKKEDYDSVNKVLFGSIGVIPLIISTWAGTVVAAMLLPKILSTLTKLDAVFSAPDHIIGKIVGKLIS